MSGVTEVMHPRLELPPGFRFHPTDEELATHYLTPKVLDPSFSCLVIADVNLNECEPSDLPGMAKMGEKEWYFFVHKGRRYPTGTRINRATKSGYWKATGRDKEIFRGKGRDAVLVGMKKTLVFYTGRAPRGGKTPWVMHEYRLDGKLPANMPRSAKDQWAVCRVINKDLVVKNGPKMAPAAGGMEPIDFVDNDWLCTGGMPPLMDSPFGNDDDFTTGASSSTSGAVVMPEQDMGFYEVKTEQPAPPQEMQSPDYFSLPATSYYQGNQQDAIRRHSRPAAPSLSALPVPLPGAETEMPSLMPSPYLELDDFSSDPLDYFLSSW